MLDMELEVAGRRVASDDTPAWVALVGGTPTGREMGGCRGPSTSCLVFTYPNWFLTPTWQTRIVRNCDLNSQIPTNLNGLEVGDELQFRDGCQIYIGRVGE